MARIVRENVYNIVWQFFRQLFRINGDFDCGTINLCNGKWLLFFETCDRPSNVWFKIEETFNLPVCGGSTSLLGASLTVDGFWLFADIRSAEAEIHWFASEY